MLDLEDWTRLEAGDRTGGVQDWSAPLVSVDWTKRSPDDSWSRSQASDGACQCEGVQGKRSSKPQAGGPEAVPPQQLMVSARVLTSPSQAILGSEATAVGVNALPGAHGEL